MIKNVVSDFLKERGIWRDRVIHKNAKILRWKKETVTLMIAVSLYTHKILAISLNKKPSFLIAILDTLGIFNNCRFWGYIASLNLKYLNNIMFNRIVDSLLHIYLNKDRVRNIFRCGSYMSLCCILTTNKY